MFNTTTATNLKIRKQIFSPLVNLIENEILMKKKTFCVKPDKLKLAVEVEIGLWNHKFLLKNEKRRRR